eukprot:gene32479-17714_t
MAIAERTALAFEGVVVVALDIFRTLEGMSCKCRLTTRAMWTDSGRLLAVVHTGIQDVIMRMPPASTLTAIEREVINSCLRMCKTFNGRKPEVIVIAHENDPSSQEFAYGDMGRPTSNSSNYGANDGWKQQGGNRVSQNGSSANQGQRDSAPAPRTRKKAPTAQSEGSPAEDGPATSVSPTASMLKARKTVMESKAKSNDARAKAKAAASEEAKAVGTDSPQGGANLSPYHDMTKAKAKAAASEEAKAQGTDGPLGGAKPLPDGVMEARKNMNPRDSPSEENDPDFG